MSIHVRSSISCPVETFILLWNFEPLEGHSRLGPRVKKIKNGYPESSKVCYSINLKKYNYMVHTKLLYSKLLGSA